MHTKYCFKDSIHIAVATWNEVLFQHRSSLFTVLQVCDYHFCTQAASVLNLTHNGIRLAPLC